MLEGILIGLSIILISFLLVKFGLADVPDSGWESRKYLKDK